MLVQVVPIGNSKGIRLPKAILDQLNISDKLDLEVENRKIILSPIKANPREGWSDKFKFMHQLGEDELVIPENCESEDFEWEW
jgi:antitoxin MazE